jgi:hypothetical protein
MPPAQHSILRNGIVTGLIGGGVMALWYFLVDAAAGQPFHTPNVLGKILFHADLRPGTATVAPGAVAGYTVLHFLVFVVVGTLLSLVTHLASRNLAFRMGIWIGLVVAFAFLAGILYMLTLATGERLPLWSVLGGSFLAVASMAWYLLRRHGRLMDTGRPLGDEVESPPHPSR